MNCPTCNAPNRNDAKFCKSCGRPLEIAAANAGAAPSAQSFAPGDAPLNPPVENANTGAAMEGNGMPSQSIGTVQNVGPNFGSSPQSAASVDTAASVDDPTQVLTAEQMAAYHQRRWQQDMGFEQQGDPQNQADAYAAHGVDIADVPTIATDALPSQERQAELPAKMPYSAQQGEGGQFSDPTQVGSEPMATDASQQQLTPAQPKDEPILPQPTQPAQDQAVLPPDAPTEQEELIPPPPPTATQSAEQAVPPVDTTGGTELPERNGEEVPAGEAGMMQSAAPATEERADDFPLLPVGASLNGRYEVTQVLNEDPKEHIYQVTDHQGYQHCWNCGSEENAQGDEFCSNCGAGLLGASYLMHEYPAATNANGDANVLQGTIVNTFVERGQTYMVEQPQVVQNAFPNGVELLAASGSDAGDVRRSDPNEDSTLVLQIQRIHESVSMPYGVFIVADGMGGHDSGQVASRTAVSVIAERMVRELLGGPLVSEKNNEPTKTFDEDTLETIFRGAIEDANATLVAINQRDKTDMGTTLTGFMIVGDHAYIINVGDSRTYMLRGNQLYPLTTDHSLVGQLVAGGLIEPDDVYTHPQRSQIFRSLGDKLNVQVDLFKQQLLPGDILLSCCDGLWEMIRNPQIESILSNASDPQTACTQLIEAANANGGEDNISAVVVAVH